MEYLITGGAGFIGSHLADELLRRGNHVTVIDDLSTGSIQNIEDLRSNSNFKFVQDTVMNRPLMSELVDRAEVIFHLAAAVGVRLVVESPLNAITTNVAATQVLLGLAMKGQTVVITSSSEVYGKSEKVPFSEGDGLLLGPPDKLRWSYGCSKAINEFFALASWRERGVRTIVVRLFNTIGPHQTGHYGMVVPRFVGQALAGEALMVYGDGRQTRCFGWVGDVVNAMIALSEHPGAVGKVFNVGGEEEVTINELAERIKRLSDSHSSIKHVPYHEVYNSEFEDMRRRVPDLRRINDLIGYKPTKTLDEMLFAIITFTRDKAQSLRSRSLREYASPTLS